jgi:hypothetical protein
VRYFPSVLFRRFLVTTERYGLAEAVPSQGSLREREPVQAGDGRGEALMPQSVPDDGHVQELLGVYLLGGMSAPDAAAVRAHLDVCQECRDEHDYLGVVPEWLNLVKDSAANRPRLRLIADPRGPSPQ